VIVAFGRNSKNDTKSFTAFQRRIRLQESVNSRDGATNCFLHRVARACENHYVYSTKRMSRFLLLEKSNRIKGAAVCFQLRDLPSGRNEGALN
jgi:hypothetical protein